MQPNDHRRLFLKNCAIIGAAGALGMSLTGCDQADKTAKARAPLRPW